MKFALTGVTSFSGAWFAKELLKNGHEVIGFTREENNLNYLQKQRLDWIQKDSSNFQIISQSTALTNYKIDRLCLHGTSTMDYRNPNFDIKHATQSTVELTELLAKKFDCASVVHTGTFSEENESAGNLPLRSFNPYSTSKTLIYKKHCELFGEKNILKYVMPNPFGPLEPPKFTDYLLKNWAKEKTPIVNTPNYIRDNVPIDLLAKHFTFIVTQSVPEMPKKVYPSKYIESVGAFANRYVQNLNLRNGSNFEVVCVRQHEYIEPRIRVNTDFCEDVVQDWSEVQSWDLIIEDSLKRLDIYRSQSD